MNRMKARMAFALFAVLSFTATLKAQQTTTYTNNRGDTVTDTRSLQNGQYTNDKTITTPNGKTYSNDQTASLNNNGRLVTQDTRTGPNGGTRTFFHARR